MPKRNVVVAFSIVLFLGYALPVAGNSWPRAIQAFEEENYPLADSLLGEIIKEFPNRSEAHLYRAQSRYWLGDYNHQKKK